jgi:hypothetical protein
MTQNIGRFGLVSLSVTYTSSYPSPCNLLIPRNLVSPILFGLSSHVPLINAFHVSLVYKSHESLFFCISQWLNDKIEIGGRALELNRNNHPCFRVHQTSHILTILDPLQIRHGQWGFPQSICRLTTIVATCRRCQDGLVGLYGYTRLQMCN